MGTLTLQRSHLPFWPTAALAVMAWLVAWFAAWPVSQWVAFDLLGLEHGSAFGEALAFFLYDVPKVLLLLLGIVTVVSFLRSYVPPEKVRAALTGRGVVVGTTSAAAFGVVTPFCSCSAVPLFIGFLQAGIPVGVTLAFLISSPLVNEVALVLLLGLFGWQIAVLYLVAGLTIAIVGGLILGRLPLERWIEPWVLEARDAGSPAGIVVAKPTTEERLRDAWDSTRELVRKVWPWVVIGIGVGAFLHGFVPTDVIVSIGGADNPFAVPIVVILAAPLYAGAAGVIPIVETLLDKGLPLGTVLAFMMATVAISLPEFVILRRVARIPLLLIFLAVVVVGILMVGFLFNALGM
jgi:uncharacterized membrane protein YraQ (UPF0718 family)